MWKCNLHFLHYHHLIFRWCSEKSQLEGLFELARAFSVLIERRLIRCELFNGALVWHGESWCKFNDSFTTIPSKDNKKYSQKNFYAKLLKNVIISFLSQFSSVLRLWASQLANLIKYFYVYQFHILILMNSPIFFLLQQNVSRPLSAEEFHFKRF